jgi:D-inositol-3-phosphate glycosyltransferase
MTKRNLDVIIIGPAYPYRGGISNTNHEFSKALKKEGYENIIITFKTLYPAFLFPGKNQYTKEVISEKTSIERHISSYNPITWIKTARKINNLNPKIILFRYYTPFLSPSYSAISKMVNNKIKKIALVDNWIPHEKMPLDRFLNKLFAKQVSFFVTLSKNVTEEIKATSEKQVLTLFHPINTNMPPLMPKALVRKILGWPEKRKTILFFGLIRKYKGLNLLLRSFSKATIKNNNIHLVIAGEFYDSKKKYINLIKKLKIGKQITIYNKFINNDLTQKLFCASDALVQTYVSASQSGVTPLAYNYNTPILVTDINGLKEPIIEDNSGLVTSKNTSEIAFKILNIIESKNLIIYKKHIQIAKSKYKWSEFVIKLMSFVEKI